MNLERSGWLKAVREGSEPKRIKVRGGASAYRWKTPASLRNLIAAWKPEFGRLKRQDG